MKSQLFKAFKSECDKLNVPYKVVAGKLHIDTAVISYQSDAYGEFLKVEVPPKALIADWFESVNDRENTEEDLVKLASKFSYYLQEKAILGY